MEKGLSVDLLLLETPISRFKRSKIITQPGLFALLGRSGGLFVPIFLHGECKNDFHCNP